jgi:hypothetical protein
MVDRCGGRLDAMVQRGGGRLEAVVERVNIPSPNAVRFPTLQRAGGFPCILRQCRPPVHLHPDGQSLIQQMCVCSSRGWELLRPSSNSSLLAGRPSSARSSRRAIFGKEGGQSPFLHPLAGNLHQGRLPASPSYSRQVKLQEPQSRARHSPKPCSPDHAQICSLSSVTRVSEAGYISGCPPSNGAITGTMRALHMKFASYCLWRIDQELN